MRMKHRKTDNKNLKNKTVQDIFAIEVDRNKKISKTTDIIAKIVCLFAALVIWFYVMNVDSPDYEQTFMSIPISLVNTSRLESERHLSVYSGFGNTVDITVKGKKSNIGKLKNEDIVVTADVMEFEEAGIKSLNLDVVLPAGSTVGSMSQYSTRIYADVKDSIVVNLNTKIVHVIVESPNFIGTPVPEYTDVTVTGPKGILELISHAQVNLDIGKVSKTFSIIGKIEIMGKNGEIMTNPYLKLSRSEVYVNVPVSTEREIPISVAYKYGFFNTDNTKIKITPETIKLKGDADILNEYEKCVIGTVDEKNILEDGQIILPITLPAGIENVDDVETVEVDIAHKNTAVRKFIVDNIHINGAGNLKYDLVDKQISAKFRGSTEDIKNLRSSDITANINLSGYSDETSGVVSERVTFIFSNKVGKSVYELGSYTIQVKIGE